MKIQWTLKSGHHLIKRFFFHLIEMYAFIEIRLDFSLHQFVSRTSLHLMELSALDYVRLREIPLYLCVMIQSISP